MSSRQSSISPPPKRRRLSRNAATIPNNAELVDLTTFEPDTSKGNDRSETLRSPVTDYTDIKYISSPIRLNFIPELPEESNADTVSLGSILGDPLIKECWLFNYLFDVDFILQQFDPDVRSLVQIKLVHGSWRREDANGLAIEAAAQLHPNIQNITAYMPEPFGTHHSKMIILFRHDDAAQVIITTGNFIEKDWSMSQAFWLSPVLPLLNGIQQRQQTSENGSLGPLGSGATFKHDLLSYLSAYGSKLASLHSQLQCYDFISIRAALVASVPSKIHASSATSEKPLWGLEALKRVLRTVPMQPTPSRIVSQISSIASMGSKYITDVLFPAFNTTSNASFSSTAPERPHQSIVFPCPSSIRSSILGFASGASIHCKSSSPAQQAQVDFLHPYLCHWEPQPRTGKVGRWPAAPHIKTYVRFSGNNIIAERLRGGASSVTQARGIDEAATATGLKDEDGIRIDWGMVTSANLSKQAWGAMDKEGKWRVQSYEIGVVFWPGLWDDEHLIETSPENSRLQQRNSSIMVPLFKKDLANSHDVPRSWSSATRRGIDEEDNNTHDSSGKSCAIPRVVVGWRMPYDLPLRPYEATDEPWCNGKSHAERDWMGRRWK